MNLEIDDNERGVLLVGLSMILADERERTSITVMDLIKRLAALQPEPELEPLDCSVANYIFCSVCGVRSPTATFSHELGCQWQARYGR